MARRWMLELVGDPQSLLRSFKRSSEAANGFQRILKELAVTAKHSAEAQVQASVKKDARLRQEIKAYHEIASAAKRGSQQQVVAARLAAQGETRLSKSLGVTAREARSLAAASARAERSFGRAGLARRCSGSPQRFLRCLELAPLSYVGDRGSPG
jgi:hypothetical protein